MPGEGVSRANPTVLLWQPPQTGLGLHTEAGWGMAGRWATTALHGSTLRRSKAQQASRTRVTPPPYSWDPGPACSCL